MTELKKIELTEEALDQVSGGKINFGKNTFKKIAIVGAALLVAATVITIGGKEIIKYYNTKKKQTPNWNSMTDAEKQSIYDKINKQNQEEQ